MILSKGRTLEVPLAELERRRPRADHEDGASTLEDVERTHIRRVLGETNWMLGGPRGAAARLGMKRTTLQSLMRRSEEHTSELQSLAYLVCRLLLEKKNKKTI